MKHKYGNINTDHLNGFLINKLKKEFMENGYVKIKSFFDKNYFSILQKEVKRIHADKSRKDFIMPGYSTPRNLSVIGGSQIKKESAVLIELYKNKLLIFFLECITGQKLYPVSHLEEFMVINFLEQSNDTHGWHLDDPSFAFIIVIDAPVKGKGGEIEYISHWPAWQKEQRRKKIKTLQQQIDLANKERIIQRDYLRSGDCYLLYSSNNLHRVSPLLANQKRAAINLAFSKRKTHRYGSTADYLYGDKEID